MGTKGHQLQCRCSCQKMCWKEFPKNVPLLSQLCSMPIKVANRSIVQHMGTKGDRQQCRCLCQKFGVEGISKMSMTLPITFQANQSCKRKHSTEYWNYSGSARLTCDYKAISVQLQLQLPTGTELGNMWKYVVIGENGVNS